MRVGVGVLGFEVGRVGARVKWRWKRRRRVTSTRSTSVFLSSMFKS